MRLIDADAFNQTLMDAQATCKKNGGNVLYGFLNNVRANLANFPTAQQCHVKPIMIKGKRTRLIKCGNCNSDLMSGMKYCPQCGVSIDWESV